MTDLKNPNAEFSDEDTDIDDGTGIEPEKDESITEPFDPALIRVDTRPMTIDLLLSRIQYGELDLAPDFQRMAGIWNDEAKSRLIESILIRIPLPAFYMDATNDEKWVVIDGLQRLTTLKRFVIDKELRLCGLEFLKQLIGKTYAEIPRNFQRRIAETQVTVYLIEKGTPPEVKFNIFRRINTGGLPLSLQEIRHALNQGNATRFLPKLAKSDEFKRATNNGIRDKRMADREFVLRFIAFTITPYSKYESQEFDSFLSDAMAIINRMSDSELENIEYQFRRSMMAAFDIFEKDAFRKRYKVDARRSLLNKALFEAWSVNLNKLDDNQLQCLKERKEELKEGFIALMNDRSFDSAISQGTGDINKVKRRFSAIEQLIKDVLS